MSKKKILASIAYILVILAFACDAAMFVERLIELYNIKDEI